MQITPCLLDKNNLRAVDGLPIGEWVTIKGKAQLWNGRPADMEVDTVVIHYTSAINVLRRDPFNIDIILKIFCDFAVSSHYLINRDGDVMQLAPDEARAWHCGGSIMPYPDLRADVNDFSIGIELVATQQSGYTEEQYGSFDALCGLLRRRFPGIVNAVGHEHIAGDAAVARRLRPVAKADPGPLFDWARFRKTAGFS
jgi:N-acetylmuramoyl-L-alanine amidase